MPCGQCDRNRQSPRQERKIDARRLSDVVVPLHDGAENRLQLRVDWNGKIWSAREVGRYNPLIPPDVVVCRKVQSMVADPDGVMAMLHRAISTGRKLTIGLTIVFDGGTAPRSARIHPTVGSRVATVHVFRPLGRKLDND